MTLKGMDTAAGLLASGHIDEGSQQLLDIATRLDQAIEAFEWTGADAERTRDTWHGSERPALDATAQALAAMALLIRQEAEAQDVVSGEGGAAGPGAGAGSAEAAPAGFLARAASFIGDRIGAAFDGITRTLGHAGDFVGKLADVVTGREDHSVSEIAASALATVGAAAGTVVGVATGKDEEWFGEGPGQIGTPTAVPTDPAQAGPFNPALATPQDLPSLMQSVTDSYQVGSDPNSTGDVRITRVDNGGTPAYVVSIPGTERWNPDAGAVPRDLSANLNLVAGNPTAAAETVRQAMAAADIPSGSPVLLVGHSQGGIIAAQLASDPGFVQQYGVTNVLTYGAPIDHVQLAPGVDALQVQHRFDVVPRLDLGGVDLGGTNPNTPVTTVTLDSPGGVFGAVTNHSHTEYRDSVAAALGSDSDAGRILREYQSTLAPFFVQSGGSATAIDVPVRRGD